MSFIKRLGYYLGGFSAGLIFLAFFLNGKRTQCNYGPDARVLNNLSKKEWVYAPGVSQSFILDSLNIQALIKNGDVDFDLSEIEKDSCKIYMIETELKLREYDLKVENCAKTATILSIRVSGMKIGFGAIGKGYAADRAKQLLVARGVVGGIINASGDMNTWGTQPDGSPWTIGVINPMNKEKVFSWFSLEHNAVVTSGNYEKFVRIGGKRYSHIIDPRTGIPSNGIISCTIFATKAELADALATATFVMGVESGLFLIDQLPNTEAILIDDEGIIYVSKNIQIEKD